MRPIFGSTDARIEIVDLGAWGPAALLAEYDREDDAIRVNARGVEAVRAVAGSAEAARFIACAIAHERFHRAYPTASEEEAHGSARMVCGVDVGRYGAIIRKRFMHECNG